MSKQTVNARVVLKIIGAVALGSGLAYAISLLAFGTQRAAIIMTAVFAVTSPVMVWRWFTDKGDG